MRSGLVALSLVLVSAASHADEEALSVTLQCKAESSSSRIVCRLESSELTVLVVSAAHRSSVYDR